MTQRERLQARVYLAAALVLVAPRLAPAPPIPASCERPVALGGAGVRAVRCERGAAAAASQGLEGPARLLYGLPLDPNRDSAASLQALEGIGPALASRIVAARQAEPFCSASDLERVRGIGPVAVARLAASLVPGGARGRLPEGCLRADFRSR